MCGDVSVSVCVCVPSVEKNRKESVMCERGKNCMRINTTGATETEL